jgi:hypothetical protein
MTSWEESLFTLKEQIFFNLIKNYLVDLSTPFNKQEMIQKLTHWLSKDDNIEPLIARITPEEGLILSVIYYLKDVSAEKIPLNWNEKQRENLRERLLVYKKGDCFYINPLLEEKLIEKGIIEFSLFLDLKCITDKEVQFFLPDDRLLMGFLSYFGEEKPFFLNDGSPRRRIVEELQGKIPYPAHWEDSFFGELAELFLQAELLEKRDHSLILGSLEELEKFEKYTPKERILYLALLNAPSSSRGKLRYLLEKLQDLIPTGKGLSLLGWQRLLYLVVPTPSHIDCNHWKELPRRLSLLGLCSMSQDMLEFPKNKEERENQSQSLLVQPNGDIDLPPGTPFSSSLILSVQLERGETYYRFHLTRESFESGLRRGRNSLQLAEDLEKMSGQALPSNLMTNLKEWENQLYSLRKVSGILLKATGYPRRIMNQIPYLEDHILERIGDEWILMREDTEKEWKGLLGGVGLNPFEEHNLKQKPHVDLPEEEIISLPTQIKERAEENSLPKTCEEVLKNQLESLELPEEQEKEFLRRIDRGVILHPKQLNPSIIRNEQCKAGGLDFNSKLRQVTVAMNSEYPRLELKIPGKGAIRTVKALPVDLINSKDESQLRYINELTGEEEIVAIRKILEVIRFHGSLLS